MAVVLWSSHALHDLDRVIDFLREHHRDAAATATERILTASSMLGEHPLIGRPVEQGLRELVISYGRAGYIALYDFEELADRVVILALWHHRELSPLE